MVNTIFASFLLNRIQIWFLNEYFTENIIRFERSGTYHYIATLRFNTQREFDKAVRVIYGNHPNAKPKVTIMNTDLQ